jgi:hypothetical protein
VHICFSFTIQIYFVSGKGLQPTQNKCRQVTHSDLIWIPFRRHAAQDSFLYYGLFLNRLRTWPTKQVCVLTLLFLIVSQPRGLRCASMALVLDITGHFSENGHLNRNTLGFLISLKAQLPSEHFFGHRCLRMFQLLAHSLQKPELQLEHFTGCLSNPMQIKHISLSESKSHLFTIRSTNSYNTGYSFSLSIDRFILS